MTYFTKRRPRKVGAPGTDFMPGKAVPAFGLPRQKRGAKYGVHGGEEGNIEGLKVVRDNVKLRAYLRFS